MALSKANSNKLKQLNKQLVTIENEYEILKQKVFNDQKILSEKKKLINSIKIQINSLGKDKVVEISDHAILRYLERIKGIDIEAIKEEMDIPKIQTMVNILGSTGKYPLCGYHAVVKDYIVTTVTV